VRDWRPSSGAEAAARRAELLRRVRDYFAAANVLEVDTPALSSSAVSDVQIESLGIESSAISNRPLYLHTSPEFCMKRLLAAGYPDIFSIARVFRDGEAGRSHQPEFTMIEWYRLGMSLDEIIGDTVQLIGQALGNSVSLAPPVRRDYRDVIHDATGHDLQAVDIATLADTVDADSHLRTTLGANKDDWLDLLLATHVVPGLPTDRLTVLQHYPASQAALARLCPENPDVADRFEVFLGPVELANGYVELTDAEEQGARIAADNQDRKQRGRPVRAVDDALIAALESGLPECAGVAMGLERLQMVHDKTEHIQDVITFGFEQNA
jgi:lysyl-tRNA synthetase class 2